MTEQATELRHRLVVGQKRDGRNCYDRQAKRELIEASLQPGVSVAKLALTYGINANLLRRWIGQHQQRSLAGGFPQASASNPAPFIPVVSVSAHHSPITAPEISARLPNGVRLAWSRLPVDQLASVLQLLSALPCSESIPD